MNTALIVRDESGNVLYDTSKSIYGLIKSGPVTYHGRWQRLQSSGAWSVYYDNIYKFEVEGAISPLVFVTGASNKPFQSKEGNKTVFYFAGQVDGIKVYCFDIMRPIFTGPALKTRKDDGGFTFNSLQRPLNIIGTSTPPGPVSIADGMQVPFAGGSSGVLISQPTGSTLGGVLWAYYTVNLDPSRTYAAHIPWDRGCAFVSQLNSSGTVFRGAVHEGCYGQQGGVVHCLWNSPETTYEGVYSTTPKGFMSLLSSRMPSCSYIDTAEYPYPFNPQL
ncbi:hypothetical protein RMI40_32180 [Pseudomonas protegens]|uniref:hypothetical protein n=1 Tax=Pseudomonas protegens TaxID=380021 RepID=UPI00287EB667|nr:hypothetical protein [Pseudomonas protegens]MDS9879492.1 hypothetical protein [Pseudomonas protegens]